MPIYTYRCRDCGHEFDKLQKVNDEPVKECELCGGPVMRVFHPVGIIFKGSGFYTTDYAKKEEGEKGKGEGSVDVKSEGKSGKGEDKTGGNGESKKSDEKKTEVKKEPDK